MELAQSPSAPPLFFGGQGDFRGLLLSLALERQRDGVPFLPGANQGRQLRRIDQYLIVELLQHIAFLQSGSGSRAVRQDFGNFHSGDVIRSAEKRPCFVQRHAEKSRFRHVRRSGRRHQSDFQQRLRQFDHPGRHLEGPRRGAIAFFDGNGDFALGFALRRRARRGEVWRGFDRDFDQGFLREGGRGQAERAGGGQGQQGMNRFRFHDFRIGMVGDT